MNQTTVGDFVLKLLTVGEYDYFETVLPPINPVAMEYRVSVHLAKHRDMVARGLKNLRSGVSAVGRARVGES